MCNLDPVLALLGSAAGMVAGAIAAIIIAAALNNSFWAAGRAPVPMLAAAGLAAGAAALNAANDEISAYFKCMGAPSECLDHLSRLQMAVAGLSTVLGIQSGASLAAAASAWIPWAGAAPMYVIAGALVIQAVMIRVTIAYAYELINCAEQSRRAVALPLIVTIGIELIVAWALIYVPRRVRRRRAIALSANDKS